MISDKKLIEIIESGECSLVDFKRKHHECVGELVHDILCLSNADGKDERYLIYGVENNNSEIIGINENDLTRTEENLIYDLQDSKINRLPEIKLHTKILSGKRIDFITIKNTPYKPYFLLEEKKCGPQAHNAHKSEKNNKGFITRSGIIYTRNGSVNTSVDKSANEVQIQKMWEERFGLNLSPLKRSEIYIDDIHGWQKIYESKNDTPIYTAYYINHPEFTLKYYDEIKPGEEFSEQWHLNKSTRAGRYKLGLIKVELRYHQTILKTYELINVEYQRTFPVPKYINPSDVFSNSKSIISRNTIEFKISVILDIDCNIYDTDRLVLYSDGLENFFRMNSGEFNILVTD